jgi:hypothetical protein
VLNLAPVPADRGGQPSSACKFVLVGLANHAGPDGTGAFPSVAALVRYTGLSERTVRTCLDRLQAGKFFHALGPGWRLTAAQRSRLTPAVLAALDDGARPAAAVMWAGGRIINSGQGGGTRAGPALSKAVVSKGVSPDGG